MSFPTLLSLPRSLITRVRLRRTSRHRDLPPWALLPALAPSADAAGQLPPLGGLALPVGFVVGKLAPGGGSEQELPLLLTDHRFVPLPPGHRTSYPAMLRIASLMRSISPQCPRGSAGSPASRPAACTASPARSGPGDSPPGSLRCPRRSPGG